MTRTHPVGVAPVEGSDLGRLIEEARATRRRSATSLNSAIEKDTSPAFDVLSPRERSVVALLADGYTAKEIAVQLGVSVKTIETHRSNAMEKTQVSGIAELTKYAILEGLSSLDSGVSRDGIHRPRSAPAPAIN